MWEVRVSDRFYDATPVTLYFYSKRVSAEENLFRREMKFLKTLDHPNCIKLIGTVITPRGERIFIFPRCEMSLRQYLQKYPQLDYQSRMRILQEIASAIRYLHENHVILKTINVDFPSISQSAGHHSNSKWAPRDFRFRPDVFHPSHHR